MNSTFTVNLVIVCLFGVVLLFGLAAWHLGIHKMDYAPFLAVASGSAGAIGGLLANTSTRSQQVEPPPGQAMPVHEVQP